MLGALAPLRPRTVLPDGVLHIRAQARWCMTHSLPFPQKKKEKKNSVLPISPLTGFKICLEAAFDLLGAGPTAQNVFAQPKIEYQSG